MRVLLIALYDHYSHGIRGLHSFLDVNGYDTYSYFFKYSTYNEGFYRPERVSELLKKIRQIQPDVIGFGVRSPLFPCFKNLSECIREVFPGVKIVAGGPHATAVPETCLPHADYVVVGEGECAMLDILHGRAEPGIVYGDRIKNLDILPFAHYGLKTFSTSHPSNEFKVSAYTTRGCFFACTYCQESVLKNKPIRKSVGRFKEEMDHYKRVFPAMNMVTFADSIFLYDMDWLEEFASTFSNSGINFWCAGNAQLITDEMLKTVKAAGVSMVRIGVQSGSDWLRRKVYNRKDSLDDVRRAAELLHANEINGHYDFIIESPYDTPETIADTRRFIHSLPVSAITNKFELRYWPGTPLTERAIKDGYIRPDEVEGNFLRFGDWTYVYSVTS